MKLAYALAVAPSTFSFAAGGKIRENLAVLQELGYMGVELAIRDPVDLPSDLPNWLTKYNLHVATLITGETFVAENLSLSAEDREARKDALRRLESFFPLASTLGALVVVGRHRGSLKGHMHAQTRLIDSLRSACQSAAHSGVRLVVEVINRKDADSISTLEEGAALVNEVGVPNLGLLADTFHMNLEEVSLSQPLRTYGKLIWHVHLSDTERMAPGLGSIDFQEVILALRAENYHGFLGIEILQKPDFRTASGQAIQYLRDLSPGLA